MGSSPTLPAVYSRALLAAIRLSSPRRHIHVRVLLVGLSFDVGAVALFWAADVRRLSSVAVWRSLCLSLSSFFSSMNSDPPFSNEAEQIALRTQQPHLVLPVVVLRKVANE